MSSMNITLIFYLYREEAPISSRLNAIDLYLVVCVFLVFGKKRLYFHLIIIIFCLQEL